MREQIFQETPEEQEYIFTKWVTRNGKRILHPQGGVFRFPKKKI